MVRANEPAQHPTIDITSQIGEDYSIGLGTDWPKCALVFVFEMAGCRQSVMTTTLDQAQSAGR
jgi:hypothetical protein